MMSKTKGALPYLLKTDSTAGYLKQAARFGTAGGRWGGPLGHFIETKIHVVPVIPGTPPMANQLAFAATGVAQGTATGIGTVEYIKNVWEGRGYISEAFDD